MRLSDEQSSWAGVAFNRMRGDETVTSLAAKHMKLLEGANARAKLFVLDAGRGKEIVSAYRTCRSTDIVMRLKAGQVF